MLSVWKDHLFILVYLTICCGYASGNFLALAPNEFRPGWPLNIAVTSHRNVGDKIFVNAVLRPSNDQLDVYSTVADSLSPGETKLLTMQIPEIVLASGSQAFLTVTTTGAVAHSSEEHLWYNPNSSLVYVETDKAIYKPGQKVHIRVVHVDKDLKPIIKPLTAVIVNPKDSKLEEYKDITSRTGVAEMTYGLLQSASLGKWKVQVRDDAGMLYTKEFTVEEYVLPKFSVAVKANPGYIVMGSRNTGSVITVEALYTYGKGVQGNCVLSLRYEPGQQRELNIESTKQLSPTGEAEFSDLEWMKFTDNNFDSDFKVLVTALVTDETGRTEVGQTSVIFYRDNKKVELLPKSTKVFRPGLPAELFIKVSDQAGNPVKDSEVQVDVNIPNMKNVVVTVAVPEGQTDISYKFTPEFEGNEIPYSYWRVDGTVKVMLKSNPRVAVSVPGYLYQSESGSVITVVPATDETPKVGEKIQFKILHNSSDQQPTVSYMVVSQGNIMEAGASVGDLINITPTLEMCPHAKLFVYMIAGDKNPEVVADFVDISPSRCFGKEVDVSFDAAQIRTGADTTMKVHVNRVDGSNALPGYHSVYYLGIDKSLALLQGQTCLNKDKVLAGLTDLNLKSNSEIKDPSVPRSAGQIIEAVGLAVFSAAHVKTESKDDGVYLVDASFDYEFDVFNSAPDISQVAATAQKSSPKKAEDKKETVTFKIRKNFPETWLWGQGNTDMNGHLNQPVTLPDTITTWLVSAFAINDEGLAVGSGPFELAAFQVFFLTMNLPYSIKRGEVFVLRITVFNYRKEDISAVVRLASSNQFSVLDYLEADGWFQKNVELPANRASSVEFKINATTLGLMELHVVAEDVDDGMKDEVKQKLLVKPEGEMRSRAITKAIFQKSGTVTHETFFLNWPEDKIVFGSKRVEVKITGDILGQSLSNLQHLVSMPFGCGEQNMITTVPNIYGLTYIRATGQLGYSDMEKDMITNMKTGYQRQVDMYRHRDGSYSAWGEKQSFSFHEGAENARGSVWLTAFVLKSFSKAAELITVDPTVLSSGAKFLREKQESSGAFIETGQIFRREMQSGTGSGPSLTVYVLISLLETDQAAGGDMLDLQKEIKLAVSYIKQNLNPGDLRTTNKKFLAAMGAYALSLMPDESVTPLVDQLLAVVTHLGAPWQDDSASQQGDSAPQDKMAHGYHIPRSASSNIETAAYYLLALTRLRRLGEGSVIIKWLQSQQNSLGGYQSTQDTVMALQALSEYGAAFRDSPSASLVNVREPDSGQSFNISLEGSRAGLLHTVELPQNTTTVEITVNGPANSSCVVKVVYTYYTLAGDDDMAPSEPEVSVYTKTLKVSDTVHKVEACVKSSNTLKYNGMFVTTLTLPSGEEAFDDPSTILTNNPKASRVETSEGLIHFYMNEAPGDGYCLQAQVERMMEFEVQKPGSAKIYAYYEPDTAQEVALVLDESSCVGDKCGSDGAVVLNMANILLTVIICTLVTLLLCM